MGRKKGFDSKKIASIIKILAIHQDGLWLRQIAEQTSLSPATVKHYIETVLRPLLEDKSLGPKGHPILRVIRLKPFALEKLQEGKNIDQIIRLLRLFESIDK